MADKVKCDNDNCIRLIPVHSIFKQCSGCRKIVARWSGRRLSAVLDRQRDLRRWGECVVQATPIDRSSKRAKYTQRRATAAEARA